MSKEETNKILKAKGVFCNSDTDDYIDTYRKTYEDKMNRFDEEDFMEEKIKELKKAKENVRWLLDNPTGLVDMHDIVYWAGVVKRLVDEIKEML